MSENTDRGVGGRPKFEILMDIIYLCAALIAIFAIDWSAKQRAKHFMNDERRSLSFELDLGVSRDLPMADTRARFSPNLNRDMR